MDRGLMLTPPERRWSCPNCDTTAVTKEARPHTQFHPCAGLAGFNAPMVPAGIKAEVKAIERLDYVGTELVQRNTEGRPIMAVVTTRDDGQDCAVYPATAQVAAEVGPVSAGRAAVLRAMQRGIDGTH